MIARMAEAFVIAVNGGRLFDMGHIPNPVICSESGRAAELFLAGHIGHPFSEPYCFFHTWDPSSIKNEEAAAMARELAIGDAGSLYVVDPFDMHKLTNGAVPPNTFLICEAQAVNVFGKHMLLIGDMITASPTRNAHGKVGYRAQLTRGALSVMPGNSSEGEAAGNLLDPVMSCLLLLATDGIEVRTVEAPEKLNKHRVKAGKTAIPSHYEVLAGGYVTALSARHHRRSAPGDGHHASPLPHLRRGHIRHLHAMHGGGTTWVRDAVVMVKDGKEIDGQLHRSFYSRVVQEKAT
jgi:hypothetical protein